MKRVIAGFLLALCSFSYVCVADEAPPAADDPVLEKRVMHLAEELRCLVCQNQSLADSHADLAVDLRNEIREMMKAGKSDAEIREFMVARYGDFVLYNPPVKSTTFVLWAGPFFLLLAGGIALGIYLRRRAEAIPEQEISDEEHQRARELLQDSTREQR
jgi:cytochrome c-type biogenesis protein CcmH